MHEKKYEESAEYFKKAIQIAKKSFGEESMRAAQIELGFGNSLSS